MFDTNINCLLLHVYDEHLDLVRSGRTLRPITMLQPSPRRIVLDLVIKCFLYSVEIPPNIKVICFINLASVLQD